MPWRLALEGVAPQESVVGCLSRCAKAEAFAPGGGLRPLRDKPGAPDQGATYDAAGRRAGPNRGAPDGSSVSATPSAFLRAAPPSLRAVSFHCRLRVENHLLVQPVSRQGAADVAQVGLQL